MLSMHEVIACLKPKTQMDDERSDPCHNKLIENKVFELYNEYFGRRPTLADQANNTVTKPMRTHLCYKRHDTIRMLMPRVE